MKGNSADYRVQVTAERAAGIRSGAFELDVPGVHIFADGRNRVVREVPRIQMNTVYVNSGIRVEQLTDQMRDYFGVFNNNGVLVTSVDRGSAAEKAGLKAGDVIIAIDGRDVRTPSDFNREMSARPRPALKVMREKQEREIKMEE